MSRPDAPDEISVQALLESAKAVPRQPDAVRLRALARARASAAAPLSLVELPTPTRSRFPRHLVAPAAAAVLALGIAGAVYALNGHSSRRDAPARVASASSLTVPTVARPSTGAEAAPAAPSIKEPETKTEPTTAAAPSPKRGSTAEHASYDVELTLMRSAHTAYAAHDFTDALVLVGEHARRFPSGLLAEEREALRVRCLMGSGRVGEARRAAAGFAKRFPRSVLVPRVQSEVGSGAE